MRQLSERERKLIAVALLLALLALGWLLVIAPVAGGFADRAQRREELAAAYSRNSRLINAIPALRRNAERQKQQKAMFFLTAPNAALANDQLRDRLRKEFSATGGQLTAVQTVTAQPGTARAWAQGRMTLSQLQALLSTLDTAPPYLVIESLRISADHALETGHLDILDIRIEVSVPTLAATS